MSSFGGELEDKPQARPDCDGWQGTKHRSRVTMWSKVNIQSRVTLE